MHVIDLSIPVRDGEGRLGLEVRFDTPYRFEDCGWQGSTVSMFCHYATHVDAPNHFIEGGSGIDRAPLGKLIGPAALIDLSDHGANAGIGGDTLEDRGRHLRPGDIAILRTGWSDRCWGEPAFWNEGPWLRADGARWLVERGVNAVVYDFCEEEAVRAGAFRGRGLRRPPHSARGRRLQHRVRASAARDQRRAARHRRPSDQARRAGRGPPPGCSPSKASICPPSSRSPFEGHKGAAARPGRSVRGRGGRYDPQRPAAPRSTRTPPASRARHASEGTHMTRINLQFTLFSAFYSPLIATMAGGFLREEGLEPEWSVSPPGVSALAALEDGSAHVVQSALSQGFGPLERGETPATIHFAQVNEMDGFFLTAREPDPGFSWSRLEGADVVLFGGGQPLAMFKYACHRAGIDYSRINAIHPGGAAAIDEAFREGPGRIRAAAGPLPAAARGGRHRARGSPRSGR